jgi:hypothetical protein
MLIGGSKRQKESIMKTKSAITCIALALLAFSSLIYQPSTLHAQGTAFTYQGRLNSNGSPASGTYNVTFTLFDTNTTGAAIAGPATNNAVFVTNGLFTAQVDFGAGVFTGATNWLEIGVETNGASPFTTLTPRQQLTPVPYAIFAESSSNLLGTLPTSSLGGTYGNAVTLNNAGNSFSGSFAGNGAGVTNVNVAALNGLNATNFWQTTGNSGTTAGANYLGTSDNQPLELHVNGNRGWELVPTVDSPNVIGGANVNSVAPGVQGATIGGGGSIATYGQPYPNVVGAFHGTIGGGLGNAIQAAAIESTIAGGNQNSIQFNARDSIIGGGYLNNIQTNAVYATIGGGYLNIIQNSDFYATIGGGVANAAGAYAATVCGGQLNVIAPGSDHSAIGGGWFNGIGANDYEGTIAGGYFNSLSPAAAYSTIGGGEYNTNGSGGGTIAGGQANTASGQYQSTVGGGYDNTASSSYATISGGYGNVVGTNAAFATIGGGAENIIQTNDAYATIGGGGANAVGAYAATVGGGQYNSIGANDYYGTIAGGVFNTLSPAAAYLTIGGGEYNTNSSGGGNHRRRPSQHRQWPVSVNRGWWL